MKMFRGLQSENELGGWNRILGEINLKHDCQISFFKILNFTAIQFLGLCPYFKSKNNSLLC